MDKNGLKDVGHPMYEKEIQGIKYSSIWPPAAYIDILSWGVWLSTWIDSMKYNKISDLRIEIAQRKLDSVKKHLKALEEVYKIC